jgi:hypothetical protein
MFYKNILEIKIIIYVDMSNPFKIYTKNKFIFISFDQEFYYYYMTKSKRGTF